MNDKNDKNFIISVVVCTFSSKRFGMTVDCINSIFDNTYKNYEIILVIDGNKELRQKLEHKFKDNKDITIIENEKNEGPSISRNRGVDCAKGDIVAFIDDDAFATQNWLENIVKNFSEYPEILAVGGKLLPVYDDETKRLPEEILWLVGGTYKGHPENRQFVRNVFTGNMAVKRYIFKDINFEIMVNKKNSLSHQLEDTLFCVRLNNMKSNTVLYEPEIIVYHHVPNYRLKISSILKRAFDEGILKAKLEDINRNNGTDESDKNRILYNEHSYLNAVLVSIIKSLSTLKIRDGILMLLIVLGVSIGYTIEYISSIYNRIGE